jgi:hypothetical protein
MRWSHRADCYELGGLELAPTSILVDFRAGPCAPGKPLLGLSGRACEELRKEAPTTASSLAFRDFMNAYAVHKLQKTPAARLQSLKQVGAAAAQFYHRTRELGCALNFPNLAEAKPQYQSGTSPFCSRYFEPTANAEEKRPLEWDQWFL